MPRVLATFDTCEAGTHAHDTSPDASTIKTLTAPKGAVAALVTVETNACRMTLDKSDPTSTGEYMVLQKDSAPVFIPLGHPHKLIFTSTTSGDSLVRVTWLS